MAMNNKQKIKNLYEQKGRKTIGIDPATARRFKFFAAFIKKGKVLDIGCRDGEFQEFLPQGIDYTGLDISQKRIERLKGKGLKGVRCNICLEIPEELRGQNFDYVILGDLLEHLDNPGNALANIRSLLKKRGKILGSVPNALGFLIFLIDLIGRISGFKISLESSEHQGHFLSFNRVQLKNLLLYSGFRKIKIVEFGNWIPMTSFFLPFNLKGKYLIFIASKTQK